MGKVFVVSPNNTGSVRTDGATIAGDGSAVSPLRLPTDIRLPGNQNHSITVDPTTDIDFSYGGGINIQAGQGATGDGTTGGFAGGNVSMQGGTGGTGDVAFPAGGGSDVSFQGGNGGTDVGTGGGAGGSVVIDAGVPSGSASKGVVYLGPNAADYVRLGSAGIPTRAVGAATIGADASPNAKAVLDVVSTTQGVLLPRMTTTQKNAISAPVEGLEVYDLTLHKKCFFDGTAWRTITSS